MRTHAIICTAAQGGVDPLLGSVRVGVLVQTSDVDIEQIVKAFALEGGSCGV